MSPAQQLAGKNSFTFMYCLLKRSPWSEPVWICSLVVEVMENLDSRKRQLPLANKFLWGPWEDDKVFLVL